jgi:hypothetical protein
MAEKKTGGGDKTKVAVCETDDDDMMWFMGEAGKEAQRKKNWINKTRAMNKEKSRSSEKDRLKAIEIFKRLPKTSVKKNAAKRVRDEWGPNPPVASTIYRYLKGYLKG